MRHRHRYSTVARQRAAGHRRAAVITAENRRLNRLLWKTRGVAPYRSWWISTADYWRAVAVIRAWLDGTIMTLDRDLLLRVAGRKK